MDGPNPFDAYADPEDEAADAGNVSTLPTPASAAKLPALAPNPFDEYGEPDDVPSSQGLQPSNASEGFWDSLSRHVGHSYRMGGIGGAAAAAGDAKTAAGESSLGLAPTQAQIDAARNRVEKRKAEEASFERFHSDSFAAKAGAVFGEAIAGVMHPEAAVPIGGEIAFAGRAASPVVQILGGGVRVGAVNAGLDAAEQGLDVRSGTRKSFSTGEVASSFALGAGLGSSMHAVAEGVKAFRAYRARGEATDAIQSVGEPKTAPPAEPAPGGSKAAPDADPGPMGEAVVLDEITVDRNQKPVAPAPSDVAARDAAAKAVAALSDQQLNKIADAVKLVDPATATDGTLKLPISIEEAAALKAAGINVDERGVMPAAEAAGIVAERERRREAGQERITSKPTAANDVGSAKPPEEITPATAAAPDPVEVHRQLTEWKASQPHETVEELYKVAPQHQAELVTSGQDIAAAAGAKFIDPGLKQQSAATEKVGRKGYAKAGKLGARELTDIIRGGFEVSTPQQADAVVAGLRSRYTVLDEGWSTSYAGYVDRKVLVRFGDGTIGEVQIIPSEMLAAKKGGGQDLYTRSRSLAANDPARAELDDQHAAIYSAATARFSDDWNAALGKGGIDGNAFSKASRESALPDMPTSAESTRSQALEPPSSSGSISAQASPGAQNDGRPSQIPGFIEPSSPNIGTAARPRQAAAAVTSIPPHRVSTPDGKRIDVAPIVVEARDLRTSSDAGYDASLQPRQRSRAASQAQIRDIASNLDPERLGASAEADRGAPIVGDDGTVESGNGRVLAIRSAYDQGGEAAQRYRDWLKSHGIDVDRFEQPVLVRQRTTPLSPEERRAFTVAANQTSTLSMSASEKALADSHIITPTRLDLLRNADDLGAAANQEFRRAFVKALPQAEQGAMTAADGSMSAEGLTRIRNAVLASAYGDSPVLARIAEATADEVKSISNALTAAAPAWARLKADIAEGRVPTEFDLRSDLLEAVGRTADLRGKGGKLDTFLAQQDAFDRLPGRVEQFMRMFYDPRGRKAAGAQRITDSLRFYAEEARKVSAERGLDLGLKPIRPDDIQGASRARQAADTAGSGGLFDRGSGDGARGEAPGQEARRRGADGAGQGDGSPGQGRAAGRVGDAQPLRAQPMTRGELPTAADSRFPNRQELAGESSKPRALPADATPQEVQAFRLTDAMREIAGRLGKKLEIDGRFTTRRSLGEYRTDSGVFRIRQEGDVEVFAHEVGHAIDQRLANAEATAAEFKAIRGANADELRRLDANTTEPGRKKVEEGLAEFIRSYITNPAYARKQAPNFAEEFDHLIDTRDPELRSILNDAARMSQIDSGMAPIDVFRTMIAPGSQPRGVAAFREEARRNGMLPTLGLWFDRFYAAVVGPDHWAKRFSDQLREAQFQKTGTPLPEFTRVDPYKMLRGLPGARQAALDAVYSGVRPYGSSFKDAPSSPAIYDALGKAFDGRVTLIDKPEHPLVKAFSGYLIARRSRALYERFKAGDLRNPPVRASEAETHAAIADFEREFPQFVEAADDVFAFNRAMLTKKFESGLIGRDVYETLIGRNDDYVPFFRDMGEGPKSRGGAGSAGQERSLLQRLSGSSRQIIDPLHSLIYDAVQTERVIGMNDTLKAFHSLAKMGGEFSGRFLERIPNTELRAESLDLTEGLRAAAHRAGLEKADAETMLRHIEDLVGDDLSATVYRATQTTARGERVAFYWDAGERVALKFGQDEFSRNFFDTVNAMSASERDLLLALVGKANGLFSALITDAPQFAIKNLLIDNISRVFIARNTGLAGRLPGASIVAGLYTQIFEREFAKAYAAFGGLRGGVVASLSRDLAQRQGLGAVALRPKTIPDMLTELRHLGVKDWAWQVAKSPVTAIDLLRKVVEGTETTGRLGQAKIVFKHLQKQGLSDEEAFRAALFEARDVLDYDRRGSSMYAATKLMVFLNPAIQGTERSWRTLVGAPFNAAVEASRRGGYAALDEASKSALADAVKAYGTIALGTVATMSYYHYVADDPTYQRASEYIRRKYYLFNAGQDATGKQMVITIPKPFDVPGAIFGAVEAAMDGIRRADPKAWSNVRGALMDGFLPRQVSSFQEAVTSNPIVKTAYEAMTGMKLGFDGGQPRPIVSQKLATLPPEQQYTGTTSYFAKKMGDWFGVSPLMADHVLSGIGGTAGKDANNLLTAVMDSQPNVTVKDAMTRVFFGALYREQRGAGSARNALMDLMGDSNGAYAIAANGYRKDIEDGNDADAAARYGRANDTAKTLMTLRTYSKFTPEVRQLHPLERSATIGSILSNVTRDLASSHLEEQNRSHKRGQERDYIQLEPTTARAIANTVDAWFGEEMRNGLTVAGEPGYTNYSLIDTAPRIEAIRALDPDAAKEIAKRFKKAHVLPIDRVAHNWPEVERRLLQDRDHARLGGLRHAQ